MTHDLATHPEETTRRSDAIELKEITSRLQNAFNDRLVSVILYGSAATGVDEDSFSDLNILCVLKQVTPRELSDSEPVMDWWRKHGHPSPLLMSEEEAANSTDSFPIEFCDMKERRQVLYGLDVIADLHIDKKNYRMQVEHELRAKLFRLRQRATSVLSDDAALLKLCLDSVSTFCVLGRHGLILSGTPVAPDRRLVIQKLEEKLHADMSPLSRLVDLREHKEPAIPVPGETALQLFAAYLESIRKIVEFVDGLG